MQFSLDSGECFGKKNKNTLGASEMQGWGIQARCSFPEKKNVSQINLIISVIETSILANSFFVPYLP